jgi:hypothetical protein
VDDDRWRELFLTKHLPWPRTWQGVAQYAFLSIAGLIAAVVAAVIGSAEWWAAVGVLVFFVCAYPAVHGAVSLLRAARKRKRSA